MGVYALENDSIILYDAAYEAYIQEEDIPHSIYKLRMLHHTE